LSQVASRRKSLVAGRKSLVGGRKSLVGGRKSLVAARKSLVASQKSLVAARKSLVAHASRYDLVIVDLQLPDGNGIEFLHSATDDGVLANTAAIVLTGHEFEEPDDIRVDHKPLDLDPFLDRMADIIAHTHRRRRLSARRPPAQHRATSNDTRRPAKAAKVELVLYTSPAAEKCQKAIRTVRAVLDGYDDAEVNFTICDLSTNSAMAETDAVVFTPTLVKRGPGPRTWIVGNLESAGAAGRPARSQRCRAAEGLKRACIDSSAPVSSFRSRAKQKRT
jgi:CheY-like chemotaxis protein